MSTLDRRTFVEMTLGAAVSCAGLGCASMATRPVTPRDGVVTLDLAEAPGLQSEGGFLRIQPQGHPNALYVLALPDGEYTTLSPICTHRGCTVDLLGSELVCPCHGSTYDRQGSVLEGPAERPLQAYPTRLGPNGVLTIRLEP